MPRIVRPKSCLKKGRTPSFGRRVRFKVGDSYYNFSPPGSNRGIDSDSSRRMNIVHTPVYNSNVLLPTPGSQAYQALPASQCVTTCTPATMYTPLPGPQQYTWSTPNGTHTWTPAPQIFTALPQAQVALATAQPQTFVSQHLGTPAPQAFASFTPAPQAVAAFTPAPQVTATFTPAPQTLAASHVTVPQVIATPSSGPQAIFTPLQGAVPQTFTSFTPLTSSLLATPVHMTIGPIEPQLHSALATIFRHMDWDMASSPSTAKLNPCVAASLGTSNIDWDAPATTPPDAHSKLVLRIPDLEHMILFWGEIVVKPSSRGAPITVHDVLMAIHKYLHTPINEEHEGFIESRSPEILDRGFHRRMEQSSNPASFEFERGYLRIDALGEWSRFVGLRPATSGAQSPGGKGQYYLDIDSA